MLAPRALKFGSESYVTRSSYFVPGPNLVVTGMTHLVREIRGFPALNITFNIKVPLV